jgi:hypothetical protein
MAATSQCVATVLAPLAESVDASVAVRSTFPDPGIVDAIEGADLLVLNTSLAVHGEQAGPEFAPMIEAIVGRSANKRPTLALHQSALTAGGYPELSKAIGGHWVDGVSGHPPIGDMTLSLTYPEAFPGLPNVSAFDERYCRLTLSDDLQVLGTVSDDDGSVHPACWLTANGLVAYSALGHDWRSFASPTHADLLLRLAAHLLRQTN